MSTVSLAWMLVREVRLISAPRTARKIQRNITATRSPIMRRSASKLSSRTLARSSCWRGSMATTAGVLIGICVYAVAGPLPGGYHSHSRIQSASARNAAHPRYGHTQVNPTKRHVHATETTIRRQRGQSLVEFAISSIVLLLLVMGLLDLSRAFYFAVNLQGAAREGARHGAWFNTAARANNFLDDSDVMSAVNAGLNGAGLTANFQPSGGCLNGADGNAFNNKPYSQAAYPGSTQQVNAYICYTYPGATFQTGSRLIAPSDN